MPHFLSAMPLPGQIRPLAYLETAWFYFQYTNDQNMAAACIKKKRRNSGRLSCQANAQCLQPQQAVVRIRAIELRHDGVPRNLLGGENGLRTCDRGAACENTRPTRLSTPYWTSKLVHIDGNN